MDSLSQIIIIRSFNMGDVRYILANQDGKIVLVIPAETDLTQLGLGEEDFKDGQARAELGKTEAFLRL